MGIRIRSMVSNHQRKGGILPLVVCILSLSLFLLYQLDQQTLSMSTAAVVMPSNPSTVLLKQTETSWNQKHYPALQCDAYPFYTNTNANANANDPEMVYWKTIPKQDASFQSPYVSTSTSTSSSSSSSSSNKEQFLTFEPDDAGWNNVRMGFETLMVMAIVTGRTLVLPPNQAYGNIPQIHQKLHPTMSGSNSNSNSNSATSKPDLIYNFHNIYNLTDLMDQYTNLKIITMEQFLTEQGMTGKLINQIDNQPLLPPHNQVKWHIQSTDGGSLPEIYSYLRKVAYSPLHWKPGECLAAFPDPTNQQQQQNLQQHNLQQHNLQTMMKHIFQEKDGRIPPKPHHFYQSPTPVSAPPMERLRESLADRQSLCLYSPELQSIPNIHFPMDFFQNQRLLTHFYSFLFHENSHQDLFTKRFIRDGVRYNNVIACAASTIVKAIRLRAKQRNPTSNPNGEFDTFHIRRNDFQSQFKGTKGDILQIVELSQTQIRPGSTVYIATDEVDEGFFEPMKEIYDLVFLKDFLYLFTPTMTSTTSTTTTSTTTVESDLSLEHTDGIQDYHWGMIDQMVAARGRIFHGLFYSTFSGYVMRLRGYYSVKERHVMDGSLDNSFYYIPRHARNEMLQYRAMRRPFFMREYPIAWRDIDHDVDDVDYVNDNINDVKGPFR